MKPILVLAAALLFSLASALHADSVMLKDGTIIVFKVAHRAGSDFALTVEVPNPVAGQPPGTAEVTHPLADLIRVEAPEPTALKEAPDLIAQGSAPSALTQIGPQLAFFASFGEAQGSRWADLAVLKAYALISAGYDSDAATLSAELAKSSNAETARSGQALQAALLVKKSEYDKAAAMCAALLKESQASATLASASVTLGVCHLAKKEWEDALMCFLEVPVFHPDDKIFGPMADLGAARAYFGLEDFDRSIATYSDIIKVRPAAPEAKLARTELAAVKHRKQVVEDAKK